jgi:putative ABC transport system permease protein
MDLLYLARKRLFIEPFRTIAIISSIALISAFLFAGFISLKGIMRSVSIGFHRLGADIMVVPEGYEDKARAALISGKPSVFYMPSDTVERIKKYAE